jgi:RNA polymerase sigma-70 factor (ECF subfamily)
VTDGSANGGVALSRGAFEKLIAEIRPKLHRYCARMTGSVIDGEDVVQEALAKAVEAFSEAEPLASPEAWLFRIAHNTALDFLRRRARQQAAHSGEDPDMIVDPGTAADARVAAAASLRTFMQLSVLERSGVVLMDVLGYSLDEIGGILDTTIPAVKAALHRGRTRLRELASEPDDRPLPVLAESERSRLAVYVDRFNARDFDAVRDMLADDVRLELVAMRRMHGKKEVSVYFTNYSRAKDWHFALGFVEGRPAAIAYDPSGKPTSFVLLEWAGDRVAAIRDFRHARYAMDGAELVRS